MLSARFDWLISIDLSLLEAHFYAAVEHKFQSFCLFMQTVAGTWSALFSFGVWDSFSFCSFEKFKFIKIRQTWFLYGFSKRALDSRSKSERRWRKNHQRNYNGERLFSSQWKSINFHSINNSWLGLFLHQIRVRSTKRNKTSASRETMPTNLLSKRPL